MAFLANVFLCQSEPFIHVSKQWFISCLCSFHRVTISFMTCTYFNMQISYNAVKTLDMPQIFYFHNVGSFMRLSNNYSYLLQKKRKEFITVVSCFYVLYLNIKMHLKQMEVQICANYIRDILTGDVSHTHKATPTMWGQLSNTVCVYHFNEIWVVKTIETGELKAISYCTFIVPPFLFPELTSSNT